MIRSLLTACPLVALGLFVYAGGRIVYLWTHQSSIRHLRWRRELLYLLFVGYFVLVARITVISDFFPEYGPLYWPIIKQSINIVPLWSIIQEIRAIGTAYDGDTWFMLALIVRNVGGNILLLLPLGFLAPFGHPRYRNFKSTLSAGIKVSLAIEGIQLIELLTQTGRRVVDIDDVLCNTLGTAVGYMLYCLYMYARRALSREKREAVKKQR